jgi:transposase InsO family protein
VKYAWIEAQAGWQPIARLCKVLGVSRSGFLQWRQREPSDRDQANRSLDAKVAVIHAEGRQGYGRIRITRRLHQAGIRVGAERVRKSLLRQHLRSVYRRAYRVTTDSNHRRPVAQNLLARRFFGWPPNKAWTTDITYLPTDEGWLYLAAIVDLGTRRVVGWAIGGRISAQLVCDALQMAYWRRRPAPGLLIHSDRGSQYASDAYRKLIKQFRMTQSMSRKGNCWDNAPMESFFKTLKVEHTYRLRYISREQARLDIVNWIEGFYNEKRMHSAINFRSPADFERGLKAA